MEKGVNILLANACNTAILNIVAVCTFYLVSHELLNSSQIAGLFRGVMRIRNFATLAVLELLYLATIKPIRRGHTILLVLFGF